MNADELFDEIAEELAPRGVTIAPIFGKRSLKAAGKGIGCLLGDRLAFRLGAGTPAHTEALTLAGAALFDPSGKDRPFKDWVAVPVTHAARWPSLAVAALAHTAA